jgi:hypothetical protein
MCGNPKLCRGHAAKSYRAEAKHHFFTVAYVGNASERAKGLQQLPSGGLIRFCNGHRVLAAGHKLRQKPPASQERSLRLLRTGRSPRF